MRGGEKIILGQKRSTCGGVERIICIDREHGRVHLGHFGFAFDMSGQVLQSARYTVKDSDALQLLLNINPPSTISTIDGKWIS